MAFKATKVQPVPKESKETNFTDLSVFKDIGKYEDARANLRQWAVIAVKYLEGQAGMTGRVRAIDRELKFHKEVPKEEMSKWLPKNRLPLAMYEIFPEYFDVKEEKASDTQGEGHAITLLPERPSIVGETEAP